jgi:hypothetical protein
MVTVEGLVQNRGWKKPFGGFFQKRFNGFFIKISLSFTNDCWRIKLTVYDTTKATLHSYIDDVKRLKQLYVLEPV